MTDCQEQGISYEGTRYKINLPRGCTFKNTSALTLSSGLTVSSASLKVYDSKGDDRTEVSGITEYISISGNSVDWGLMTASETAALSVDADYWYELLVVLSNGVTQQIAYGELDIT